MSVPMVSNARGTYKVRAAATLDDALAAADEAIRPFAGNRRLVFVDAAMDPVEIVTSVGDVQTVGWDVEIVWELV